MVRGLTTNWKQPLAYFFARDSTPGGHLSVLTRQCLKKYLTWVCKLCIGDQGVGNRGTSNNMG